MEIRTRDVDGVAVMEFEGPLTRLDGRAQLEQAFAELLDAGRRRFVFEMKAVPYVDSAIVEALADDS